jgi:hypothetical protein
VTGLSIFAEQRAQRCGFGSSWQCSYPRCIGFSCPILSSFLHPPSRLSL